MLPSPTAEGLLIIGLLAAITKGDPACCAPLSRGIIDFLALEPPKVRLLNEAIPTLRAAREGAGAILRTRCVVCAVRDQCKAPIDRITQPLPAS
jgi:hypothetical protein